MKRFVWRLQRVLDIKAKEEQKKTTELFQLTEKLSETRGRLLAQQRIRNDIILRIAQKKPQRRLAEQELFLKHSATSDKQIKMLKNEVSEMESQQSEKIAELLRVRRFKKALQKLRAEAKMRFVSEQERLEQKELDEGAIISFAADRAGSVSDRHKGTK
ncbi:MAG: hypothetical protein MUO33_09305 [Sedimentisphaerales bacterium]|nr:hypothetical protein [Sedimentisphaerales bacterium]